MVTEYEVSGNNNFLLPASLATVYITVKSGFYFTIIKYEEVNENYVESDVLQIIHDKCNECRGINYIIQEGK